MQALEALIYGALGCLIVLTGLLILATGAICLRYERKICSTNRGNKEKDDSHKEKYSRRTN